MTGAMDARRSAAEMARQLALMTAYFSGQLAQSDWKKMPGFNAWVKGLTQPQRTATNSEIIARFEAMAAAGLDVTVQ